MLEKIVAALESIAASLVVIATALKDAALKAAPGGAPAAAAPASTASTAAPPPAAEEGPTKEKVQSMAREFSDKYGRDEVKKIMAACGVKNVKEIDAAKIKPFFDALTKANAEKTAAADDDGLG